MNFASSLLVQTSVENAGTSEVDGLSMILRCSSNGDLLFFEDRERFGKTLTMRIVPGYQIARNHEEIPSLIVKHE